ncbi:MAG: hypothetical protein ACYTFG_17745 [Planctomycetota bacterium]|jgi:hypothetical protein
MADENEEVPETVEEALGESDEAPGYVGTLTGDEQKLLASLRQTSAQIVQKIGQHEVIKAQLLGQVGEVEARANQIITEATARFGHPEPGTWNVTPEGKVYKAQGG